MEGNKQANYPLVNQPNQNQPNFPKNPVYPGRPLVWSGPLENRVLTQTSQAVSQVISQPFKSNSLAVFLRLISFLIFLQLGWLGFRGYQYFVKQKSAQKLAQEKVQKQEKEAQVYLQEIPEPCISKEFLEYYQSTESGEKN